MTIEEYKEKHSLTWRSFGIKCDLSASMLMRIQDGERVKNVSLIVMQKIINGTNGDVSFQDLLEHFKNIKPGPKKKKIRRKYPVKIKKKTP